ncbi:hypothetical protein H8959_008035 [Pygathrix nigripes]
MGPPGAVPPSHIPAAPASAAGDDHDVYSDPVTRELQMWLRESLFFRFQRPLQQFLPDPDILRAAIGGETPRAEPLGHCVLSPPSKPRVQAAEAQPLRQRPAAASAWTPSSRAPALVEVDFMEGARGDNELPERILISRRPEAEEWLRSPRDVFAQSQEDQSWPTKEGSANREGRGRGEREAPGNSARSGKCA